MTEIGRCHRCHLCHRHRQQLDIESKKDPIPNPSPARVGEFGGGKINTLLTP